MEKLIYKRVSRYQNMPKITCDFRKALLIFGLIMIGFSSLSAKEYTKELIRSFKVNSDAKFDISNRKGNVTITTWDKNTIKIEAKIIVNAKTQEEAELFFKRIKLNFDKSPEYVKATTVKETEETGWFDWVFGGTKVWNWNVHYKISMPKTNDLKANNKFGNMYVSGIGGAADLTLKYGDFKFSGFDKLTCELAYAEGSITDTKHLDLDVKFSDLQLRNTKDITMMSKHSEIEIDEATEISSSSSFDDFEIGSVNILNSNGKYDDFSIGKVGKINVVGKHSDFEIENILNSGDFDLEYGEVVIENLSDAIESLKLIGEHTEFIIDANESSFNLVVDGDNTNINTPNSMKKTSETKKNQTLKLKGKVGKNATKSLIEVRTKYGSLKIIQQ
jgi:hypothetical protein